MTGRLIHISDLHVGRADGREQLDALRELIPALDAELVVVTGDLAHRGRRVELEQAGTMLDGLGATVLAVRGNHDLPYAVPERFTRTAAAWGRVFGTTEPTYASERLAVVGLDSARPWRHESGALDPSQLARVELVLSGHVHQSSVVAREEFEVLGSERRRSIVLATAAGLGRPRPHRRGEAVGFNLYEFDRESITAVTWCWSPRGVFFELGRRRFGRR